MTTRYEDSFRTASEETGIPIDYLKATAMQETGIRQINSKHSSALGVMQVIPQYHPALDPERLANDPDYNIRGASAHLADLVSNTDPNLPYEQRFSQALGKYYGSKSPTKNRQYASEVLAKVGKDTPQEEGEPDNYLLPGEEDAYKEWVAKQPQQEPDTYILPGEEDAYKEWLAKQPKEELPDRTMGEYASDIGTTAEKTVIGALQGVQGLADIAGKPFGLSPGKAMDEAGYDLSRMQKELEAQYTPQQQAENKALQEATGVAGNLEAAWEHPTAVAGMVGESIGPMVAGGMFAKVAKAAGVVSEFLAAGIGEGVITAGQTAGQIREQAPDKELSTKGALASIGAGVGTGILGRYGSELVTKMGGIDPTLLVMEGARKAANEAIGEGAKTPGFFKAALVSAFGEGILEEAPQSAQEQMWQNYATDKPLLEGVKDATIKGAIIGAVMGAGAKGVSALAGGEKEPPTTSEEAQAQLEIAKANQAKREGSVETPKTPVEEVQRTPEELLKSWGIPAKSKLHADLKGQDFFTPEGLDNINSIIEAAGGGAQGEKALASFKDDAYIKYRDQIGQPEVPIAGPTVRQPAVKEEPIKEPDFIAKARKKKAPVVEEVVQDVTPIYSDLPSDKLEQLSAEAKKTNFDLDYNAIKKHMGVEEADKYAGLNLRARNKWWEKGGHTQELENDSSMFKGINEDELAAHIHAKQDFDDSSPIALGESIALKMMEMGQPNFENSPEHTTIKSALKYAKDQNWDISEVIQGAREKAFDFAGDDAPELFTTLFKAPKNIDTVTVQKYDTAINKVEGLDSIGKIHNYIKKLRDDSLITNEHLADYARLRKDGVSIEGLVGKVKEDLQAGKTIAETTPIAALPQGIKIAPIKPSEGLGGFEKTQNLQERLAAQAQTKKEAVLEKETLHYAELKKQREAARDKVAPKKVKPPSIEDLTTLVESKRKGSSKPLTQEEIEYSNELSGQREDDFPFASVAPSAETTKHTADTLKQSLSPEMKRLVASGKAVIHNTAKDLSRAVPGKHPTNIQGLTTKEGVTHYVANKLTPETLHKVALHETGVHAGMEKMLGKDLWEDVKTQALNNKGAAFDAARAAVPANTPEHLKAEETLAYLVEHSPQLPLIRQIVAAIRTFLRTKLGATIKLTEADARHLAEKAVRKESKTKELTPRREIAYAVAPQDATPEAQRYADRVNARMAAQEVNLINNPTPKMSRFRRTLNRIQNYSMDDSATFINESARRLKELGVPFSEARKLMLAVSKSQAWHDTGLAAAAIKLGNLAYIPEELKFVAVEDVNNLETIDTKVKSIGAAHGDSPAAIKQVFNEVMVARRIIEIRQQAQAIQDTANKLSPILKERYLKKPSNVEKLQLAEKMHISEADTTAIIQEAEATWPDLFAADGPIAMWNKVRVNAINTLVATGFWTADKAETYINNAAYTPFYRDMTADQQNEFMDDMQTNSIKGAKGLLGHRKEHRIKGSERQVKDVVENMEQWLASAYTKAIKNHKAIQMVNFMQDYMPQGSIERLGSDADHTGGFYVFREGVKEWYRAEDPLFTHAFVGMPPTTRLAFLTPAIAPARTLRNLIVLNPLFTVAQLPQDTFSAMYTSNLKHSWALPWEVAKEFTTTLLGKSKTAKHLYRRGAAGVIEYSDMAVRRDLELSMGIDRSSVPKTAWGKTKKTGGTIKRALEHFAMIGDNAIRQAVYNRTMKEMGGGIEAERMAVERAFEVINFRKRGVSAGIDMLRQIVPFFGAYLQVQNVALKTLSGTGIAPMERKKALVALAGTTAQVIALSLAYNALIGGDEELEDIDPKQKDKKLYVPFTDKTVTIPLRPDVFLLPHVFMTHIFDALGKGEGKENSTMAKRYIYDALVQSIPTISALPTLIKAPLENMANHDFFTGRAVVGMGLEGRHPAEQWAPTTSETSKQLGALTSGLPDMLQISPVKVDHFIRGFAGSVGVALLAVTDAALRKGMGIPSTDVSWQDAVRKFPGASPFIASDKGSRALSEYYIVQDESNKAFNSLKTYETQPDKYEAYLTKHEALVDPAVRSELSRISQTLADIREAETEIRSLPDSDMSPAEKKIQLKELETARKESVVSMRDVEDAVFGK